MTDTLLRDFGPPFDDDLSEPILGAPPTRARNSMASALVVVLADIFAMALAGLPEASDRASFVLFVLVLLGTLALSGSYLIHLNLSLLDEAPGLLLRTSFAFFFATAVANLLAVPRPGVITALFASFASLRMTPLRALLLSAALAAFSTAVFSYGLGLPFERIGPWLR